MNRIDTLELAELLRDAALAEILPRFRRLVPGTVQTKSNPSDLVTEADTRPMFSSARWSAAGPYAGGGRGNRWRRSVASRPLAGAEVAITVDPVDARPFRGRPATVRGDGVCGDQGRTVAGIIYVRW